MSKRNLSESKRQALHALVSSLSGGNDASTTSDELTQRLDNILGDAFGDNDGKSDGGQILNEEGLPIIDITEPVEQSVNDKTVSESYIDENDPKPLSKLSSQERLRLNAERDHILDMLEAEEEEDAAKEAEQEEREARDLIEKAKADAIAEAERKAAAREMQKKMGKALMAGLAKSRTEVETTQEPPASQQEDTKEKNTRSTKPKKKVTFDENAKDGNEEQTTSKQQRHMDVSFAPLRESRSSLRPKSTNFDGLPMKMNVVERQPQKRPVDQYSGDGERIADSDDESDEELGNNVAKGSPSYTSDDRQSDEDDGSTSDLVLGSDDDMDVSQAQLQREAALEYFRLRESMGAELSQVLSTTTHDEDDPWNRPEVPLEATLASSRPKSGISRFKASRKSTNTTRPESISVAGLVVPGGDAQKVQKSVRNGKLVDGKLVGGQEGESASEDEDGEEAKKRMIELLTRGNPLEIELASRAGDTTLGSPQPSAGRVNTVLGDPTQSGETRSHPTVTASTHTNTNSHPPTSSNDNVYPPASDKNGVSRTTQPTPFNKTPTAIPTPRVAPSVRMPKDVASQPGGINNTVLPSHPETNKQPPSFPAMIIESPSFPRPNSGRAKVEANPVMGSVVERTGASANSSQGEESTAKAKPKLSRFKAERL